MNITILGIESSCDDTSAAILRDGKIRSNIIANQDVHKSFGGVVPELASRAHQQNVIPVVDEAIRKAGVEKESINAVAFTKGPGLMGALLVGVSFAKGFALSRQIPLIEVNHLQAHILAHFIKSDDRSQEFPDFPFLCLLVSGGHTQLVKVNNYLDMEVIGQTIDDAAGEAFDKCAKVMGLPYPGGPLIDKKAKKGNPQMFHFAKPKIKAFDYSFSGLKTSFLYFLRDQMQLNPDFITENEHDICASLQSVIIDILMEKLMLASEALNIKQIALAGGVSANSGLRDRVLQEGEERNWDVYIPPLSYSTDNAAMIAITGYYKFMNKDFSDYRVAPLARMPI